MKINVPLNQDIPISYKVTNNLWQKHKLVSIKVNGEVVGPEQTSKYTTKSIINILGINTVDNDFNIYGSLFIEINKALPGITIINPVGSENIKVNNQGDEIVNLKKFEILFTGLIETGLNIIKINNEVHKLEIVIRVLVEV